MRARYALCVVLAFGLGGCPTVDLGDTPEDVGLCNPAQGEPYFESTVWPMFLDDSSGGGARQCTKGGCHDQNGQSALRFKTNPIDFQANFKTSQIYLNCGSPVTSRLLEKPLVGPETHGGGDIFMTTSDPAVVAFLAWFNNP